MTDTLPVPTIHPRVEAKLDEIVRLCRRFGVLRLDLFGSAALGTFDSFTSDYDFLVTYPSDYDYGPWMGRFQALADELKWTMGRPVDLLEDRLVNANYRVSVDASRVNLFDATADK
jgi:predicted nucleotidyltransferase